MYVMYYIIGATILMVGVLLYAVINLYRKNRIYENWITDTKSSVGDLQKNIRDIDSKQLFEKDDEVGVVYTGISDLIGELNKKVKEE